MESKISPKQEKILIWVLFFAILISAFSAFELKPKDKYTEFFILGEENKAENYPTNLKIGDDGKVIVGMVNHEQGRTDYLLKAEINGEFTYQEPLELNDGEKTLRTISFKPLYTGEKRLELTLFRNGDSEPYLSLRLYLEVVE
jgi:uncharacterized membrane protein